MKGTTRTRALAFSSALSLSAALATPAWAQQPANPPSTAATSQATSASSGDEEIVVTARRKEELLQDVPISITVFNQQQLDNRNVTNAQDLAIFTPSLSATTQYGATNSTFALRGFVQETGTAPSVGVYFADVVAPRGPSQGFPAGDGAGPGMFFDLQNVQVLKGPQGTLFGRNTTGGAVLLVPQKPTDRFEGYVQGSLGNFSMKRLQGVINIPLADSIRFRFGADWQKRDGFLKNNTSIGPRDFDDVKYYALRGSLVIDVTPELENYTIASFANSDTNGHPMRVIACNPAAFLGFLACNQIGQFGIRSNDNFWHVESDVPDAYNKFRQWQVINTTTWHASDNLTVKNIASYARLWTKTRADLFGTAFVIPQGLFFPGIPGVVPPYPPFNAPTGFANIRHLPGGYSSNESTLTEEFQLQGNFGEAFNWQAGAYYEDAKPKGFIGSQSPVFIGCSDPDNFVCTDFTGGGAINYTAAQNTFKTRGVYAQATYAFTDQLKVTGGIRYTWDKIRSLTRRITYKFPTGVPNASPLPLLPVPAGSSPSPLQSYCTDFDIRTPPLCQLDEHVSFHKPTWLIDLDYNITKDVMVYAKYSRGYRSGGIKSDVPIEFHIFQPEKVDAYELGAKTEFHGAVSGHFNAALFYNNFSNQQIQFGFNDNPANPTVVTPTAGPVNVGKSRIWGLELDTRLRLFRAFTVDGGYTYLHTKVKEVITPTLPASSPYVPNGFVQVGDPLILAPKHKLSLTGTYELPLPPSVGTVSLGVTWTYTSKQLSNYSNRIPAVAATVGGVDLGTLDSFSIVNLNASWNKIAGGPVDLSAFVTNLFNKKYFTNVPGLLGSTGFESASLGEPRFWGVRAKFRFGAMAD